VAARDKLRLEARDMDEHPTRRRFMHVSAAAVPAALLAADRVSGAAQEQIAPGSEELTHYQIGPHIWMRWAQ